MTEGASAGVAEQAPGSQRLAVLLAMAMFVLVVDTSLMNVSISAVVRDLGTTVSGVQSAIDLEGAIMLATLSANEADASTVLPPDDQEIIRINTDARPIALQVALLVPLLAGLVGFFGGFRMMRLPDPEPTGSGEAMVLG